MPFLILILANMVVMMTIMPGVNAFYSVKRVDISKIAERYYIDNFNNCEMKAKGWLLAARCKGNRIYIADL